MNPLSSEEYLDEFYHASVIVELMSIEQLESNKEQLNNELTEYLKKAIKLKGEERQLAKEFCKQKKKIIEIYCCEISKR